MSLVTKVHQPNRYMHGHRGSSLEVQTSLCVEKKMLLLPQVVQGVEHKRQHQA